MRATVALAMLAACQGSDPYSGGGGNDACLAGSFRDPGPGCTSAPLAALTVDGNAAEWTDPRVLYGHTASCCHDGDPGELHIARLADGSALAMFIPVIGKAITDGSHYYDIALRRQGMYAGQPGDIITEIVIQPSGSFVGLNGRRLYGIPIESAFGANGIELRVPIDALPYPGTAYFDTWLVRASDNMIIDASAFSSQACWDPTSPDSCQFF